MDGQVVTATRSICRYPLKARYIGHGNTNEAANFVSRAPELVPWANYNAHVSQGET